MESLINANMKNGKEVRSVLLEAERYLTTGQPEASILRAEAILQSDPDHLGALEVLARAQWRSGDFRGVLRSVQRLVWLNPYEPGYHVMRGDSLSVLGLNDEAQRAYERAEKAKRGYSSAAASLPINIDSNDGSGLEQIFGVENHVNNEKVAITRAWAAAKFTESVRPC